MKKIIVILLVLILYGCSDNGPSGATICPCTVTKVSKTNNGYEITVKGRAFPGSEGWAAEFTFTTTSPHSIGDEIK